VAIEKGCAISSTHKAIIIKKDAFQVAFDKKVNCKNGFVCGIDLDVQMAKTSEKRPDDFKKSADITTRCTNDTTKNSTKRKMK